MSVTRSFLRLLWPALVANQVCHRSGQCATLSPIIERVHQECVEVLFSSKYTTCLGPQKRYWILQASGSVSHLAPTIFSRVSSSPSAYSVVCIARRRPCAFRRQHLQTGHAGRQGGRTTPRSTSLHFPKSLFRELTTFNLQQCLSERSVDDWRSNKNTI